MEPPAPPLHRAAAFQARRTQIRLLEAFPDVFGIRKSLREPGTWPGRAGVRAHPVGTFVISGSVPCTRNVLSLLKKTGRPGTPDVEDTRGSDSGLLLPSAPLQGLGPPGPSVAHASQGSSQGPGPGCGGGEEHAHTHAVHAHTHISTHTCSPRQQPHIGPHCATLRPRKPGFPPRWSGPDTDCDEWAPRAPRAPQARDSERWPQALAAEGGAP